MPVSLEIQVTLHRLSRLYPRVSDGIVYIYVCNNINEKRGHEFEREQGEVCGRVWREKIME